MKKIFCLLVAIFTMFCCISCFSEGDTSSFEITNYPKGTYVLGEEFDWSNLVINVDGKSIAYGTKDWNDMVSNKSITYSEPTTDKEGTYSITIKYESLSASFQYAVLASYFANGNGTITNPYQISTLTQFEAALTEHNQVTYYVIINDIDLSNYVDGEKNNISNLVIDGQNYKLDNVKCSLTGNVNGEVTLKNFDVHFDADAVNCGYGFIFGGLCGWTTTNNFVKLENINAFGKIVNAGNLNSLFGYLANGTYIFDNVNNYAYMEAVNSLYCAVFTTIITRSSVAYFTNCKNYGTAVGKAVSLFNGCGKSYGNDSLLVLDSDTKNYGEVISTQAQVNLLSSNAGNDYADPSIACVHRNDVYNYDSTKGYLDYNKAKEYYVDNLNVKYDYVDDYANLAKVNAIFLDAKVAYTLEKSTNKFTFEISDPSNISKVARYNISIIGQYCFDNYSGNLADGKYTNEDGVASCGGSDHRFFYYDTTSYADAVEVISKLYSVKMVNVLPSGAFLTNHPVLDTTKYSKVAQDDFYNCIEKSSIKVLDLYEDADNNKLLGFKVDCIGVDSVTGDKIYLYNTHGYWLITVTMFAQNGDVVGQAQVNIQ